VQSRRCTVTLIAPPSPAVAQFPIALQSPRQLAGILHANRAADAHATNGKTHANQFNPWPLVKMVSLRSK
jgi:hypothetical protein